MYVELNYLDTVKLFNDISVIFLYKTIFIKVKNAFL